MDGDEREMTLEEWVARLPACHSARVELVRLKAKSDRLHRALVGLVGASTKTELQMMELMMRSACAPSADKAASIDAIHALLESLELDDKQQPKGAA